MEAHSSDSTQMLTRERFVAYAQIRHGKRYNDATRAWNSLVRMTRQFDDVAGDHPVTRSNAATLDTERVRRGMRFIETGQRLTIGLGKTAWNLAAELNNEGLSLDDPDYILPWTDWIHGDFRNGAYRRERAAERLQIAYQQLGELAAGDMRPTD